VVPALPEHRPEARGAEVERGAGVNDVGDGQEEYEEVHLVQQRRT